MKIFYILISALFMIRDPDALDAIPEDQKAPFCDMDEMNQNKLKMLKSHIEGKFPVSLSTEIFCG